MMSSEAVRRRIERNFDGLDLDGSGYLAWNDWKTFADRVRERFSQAGPERHAALEQQLRRLWEWVRDQADADSDGRVSRDEYVVAFSALSGSSAGSWPEVGGPVADAIVDVIDANGDDRIDEREFTDYMALVMDIPEGADLSDVFGQIDRDGDGFISREEFTLAVQSYYLDTGADSPVARLA